MRSRHTSGSPFEPKIGFCRAIRVGSWVLVSGTGPLGPDGKTVTGGAYEQACRCFQIACTAIRDFGGLPEHVVRTRMFLTDAGDWEEVGRAHAEYFGAAPPAATMVVVAGLLVPDWRIEVEVDAEICSDLGR